MPLFEFIKCKYYSPLCNKDTKRRTTYQEGFFFFARNETFLYNINRKSFACGTLN